MMVTFVSQCEKKALKRTRRVLDSFADRIGDNTWQTIITAEGLDAVKKLLRKTASKSTAVSCHWIRSRSRTELMWIVGNRDKFNERGIVPVHYTYKNILNNYYENDWKYLPLIKALSALAALFHDWGKASRLFQEKLDPEAKTSYFGDPIRHEWISVLLLHAYVAQYDVTSDEAWLEALAQATLDEKKIIRSLNDVQKPLRDIPPVAKLLLWLMVSHHRLPSFSTVGNEILKEWEGEEANTIDEVLKYITQSWGYENRFDEKEYQRRFKHCFAFPKGLLSQSQPWIKEVKKWATRLHIALPIAKAALEDGSYRVVLHHTRLSLMLGDHLYSSKDTLSGWKEDTGLYANTDRRTKQFKQKLDEHLVGVAHAALNISHFLPAFERDLPRAHDVTKLKKASPAEFVWQDKAVSKIGEYLVKKERSGFFAVNMASTGSGKTLANAKIMQAISDETQSLRYVLALGLRTLTLQTGDEYRQRIGLDDTELAVLIGSKAVMQLHNETLSEELPTHETEGSESLESLLDEEVDYDSPIPEEGLSTLLNTYKDKKFLYAPVLVCTIDHLMGAVETKRGGRYILPSLRLMSSDLVIDEIDDFSGSDLIAIGRLIHLAAMLGRKVMISSATIPPDLAEGYFNVYMKGWQLYASAREVKNEVDCAWIDEFKTDVDTLNVFNTSDALNHYRHHHTKFIRKRVHHLQEQPSKRKGMIVECSVDGIEKSTRETVYFTTIKEAIVRGHERHHTIDPQTDKKVSFGVVRMANISPCVALSKFLLDAEYPEEIDVRVMAYHSQQVLLLRHIQEKHLDEVLKRKEKKGETARVFDNSVIRRHLDRSSARNVIFILVATPVEEVGRDHDFDWAVVEPSSYRSIIQLSGRVRRHRNGSIEEPNVALMQYNFKAFKEGDIPGNKYFYRPGYESTKTVMKTHDLAKLVDMQKIADTLDATPRIQKPNVLRPNESLADLEHFSLQNSLTAYGGKGASSLQGYLDETWFLTAHPQYVHPFRRGEPTNKIFLTYDERKESCYFAEMNGYGEPVNREAILRIVKSELNPVWKGRLWMERDYDAALERESIKRDKTKREVSLLFGELGFVCDEGAKYEYNDQFGLARY
ncbi:MAG: type I-F CRISPR-associated helicase Cas3f [Sulfuricurvum sp.]